MSLDELRQQINIIDLELLKKLKERMSISKKIGLYKIENKIEVLDKSREELLLKSLINSEIKIFDNKMNEEFINELWNIIMNYSKKNQKM